jgi:hypothetical protein
MKSVNNRFRDPTSKDWIAGILILLLYLVIILLGALLLVPDRWYWWLLLFIISTILLVLRQNRQYACRCRDCEYEFEVSFLTNLISPHGIDKEGSWMWVKCPRCQRRAKASVIKVIREEDMQ